MKVLRDRRTRINISFFIVLIFFIVGMIRLIGQQSVIRRQEIREQDLYREQEKTETEISALDNEIEHVGSDDYVERVARQRLGWVFPGEIKFIDIE